MATVSVLNTTANISGKTLMFAERDQTITGAWTFDRDPSAPFIVTAGSAVVTNLDADKLDGQDGTYYTNPSNATAGNTTVQTTTLTGAQNDFVLTVVKTPIYLRCNNATLLTLSGFVAGVDGQRLIVVSVGAGQVDFTHQATSAAANQLTNAATVGTTSLAAGSGKAEFIYDLTSTKWRLVSHEQGAWITRTFAAGNYTAGAGTWVVAAAIRDAYWLRGKTLTFAFTVTGTTNNGANTQCRILIPSGFVSQAADISVLYIANNGAGAVEIGAWLTTAAGTVIATVRQASAAIAAATWFPNGSATIEVQ